MFARHTEQLVMSLNFVKGCAFLSSVTLILVLLWQELCLGLSFEYSGHCMSCKIHSALSNCTAWGINKLMWSCHPMSETCHVEVQSDVYIIWHVLIKIYLQHAIRERWVHFTYGGESFAQTSKNVLESPSGKEHWKSSSNDIAFWLYITSIKFDIGANSVLCLIMDVDWIYLDGWGNRGIGVLTHEKKCTLPVC